MALKWRKGEVCFICGYPIAQQHRLIPGNLGGAYSDVNVICLCPNHHAALHLLMKNMAANNKDSLREYVCNQLLEDEALATFFSAIAPHIVDLRTANDREKANGETEIGTAARVWYVRRNPL